MKFKRTAALSITGTQGHDRIRAVPRFEHAHSFAQYRERSAFRLHAHFQRHQHRQRVQRQHRGRAGHSQFEPRPAGPMGRSRRFVSAETVSARLGDNSDDPYQISDNTTQFVDNFPGSRANIPSNSGSNTIARISTSYGNQFLRGAIYLPAQRHAERRATPAVTLSPNFCWATCINPR